MSDFGEYSPVGAFTHGEGSGLRFDSAQHNLYPLHWSRVIATAVKYVWNLKKNAPKKSADEDHVGGGSDEKWSTSSEIFPFFRAASLSSPASLNSFWMGDQNTTFGACDGLQSAAIGALMSTFSGWRNQHSDVGGYVYQSHDLPAQMYHVSRRRP